MRHYTISDEMRATRLRLCAMVEPALAHVRAGEDRPRLALDAARRFAALPALGPMEMLREENALSRARHAAYAAACEIADRTGTGVRMFPVPLGRGDINSAGGYAVSPPESDETIAEWTAAAAACRAAGHAAAPRPRDGIEDLGPREARFAIAAALEFRKPGFKDVMARVRRQQMAI